MKRRRLMNTILSAAVGVLAGGALLAMSASNAQAAFKLRLTTGADTVTITDNGAGDSSGVTGVISFSGSLGAFIVNVTTGVSKPVLGAEPTKFDLNSINVTGSAGTLSIELTDTDFVSPAVATSTLFTVNIGGTTNGSVVLNHAVVDPTNAEFSTGPVDLTAGGLTFGPGAFSGSASKAIGIGPGPHSLSILATITHTAAGQISSFDAEISVPEPSSLGLFGLGLLGLGLLWRRRSRLAQAA